MATRAARPETPAEVGSTIGARLRRQREHLGISLRAVSRQVGVSASLVSQIERDMVNPSVATLYALVNVLDLSMGEVFNEVAEEPAKPAGGTRATSQRVRSDDRQVINLASGVRWERLTPSGNGLLEFIYVVYEAGGTSSEEDSLLSHGGREYGFIIRGRLGVQVGSDEYELSAGDSVSFDSTVPHRLWAIGDEPVQAVWVMEGPCIIDRPDESDLPQVIGPD